MPPKRKRREIAMADCVLLPEDIMLCILTRLPVKSILRFKSVCKQWRELFSTRQFMKIHQLQFSSDPKNQSVIMESRAISTDVPMYLWNIGSDEKRLSVLDHPHPETVPMKIVWCCNGLLCMGRPRLGPGNIVLWNPAMKLFKFVRVSENEDFMDPMKVSFGVGYDGDDFKVVRIVLFKRKKREDMSIWVEMYSVNSDSWTTIEPGFRFSLHNNENIAFVNGNPYWHAMVDESENGKAHHTGDVLLWLDVRKMVFKVVPLSIHNFDVSATADVLVDWKDSLGAIVCNRDNGRIRSVDVLVYDDVDRIWRKDHSFGPIEVELGVILEYSKNGKMVCSGNGELFVYDPYIGLVKVAVARPTLSESYPFLYNESLTCIKGMRPVEVKQGKRKRNIIVDHVSRSVKLRGSYE